MKLLPALLLTPAFALAQATITWDGPSQWEDGRPLDVTTDIAEFRLYCRQDVEGASFDFGAPSLVIPGLRAVGEHTEPYEAILPERGRYVCAMTAVSVDGVASEPSNKSSLVWLGKPGKFTITIE
jgi:hypothetical protein